MTLSPVPWTHRCWCSRSVAPVLNRATGIEWSWECRHHLLDHRLHGVGAVLAGYIVKVILSPHRGQNVSAG